MSVPFITPANIKRAIEDSELYMPSFVEQLPELERIGRGKPGRVPKGKPRVTDGTLSAIRREMPKQVIQQLPTGKVTIKKYPELEEYVNAVLTDEILPNANSGGTPYEKALKAIKATATAGAAVALVFYNRRGAKFTADFKMVYVKDVLVEPGKTSEFDYNYLSLVCYYTRSDLEGIIAQNKQLKRSAGKRNDAYEEEWDTNLLQEMLDGGAEGKDDLHKSEAEKKHYTEDNGYYKIIHTFQVGVGAKFYGYAPRLGKIVKTCTNRDPRGIMPVHFLIPEPDDASPFGEALFATSAGKQNLLDFDMQMYQYNRGLLLSPPVKKYGNINTRNVKLTPDAVIDMGPNGPNRSELEAVDIDNSAIENFPTNYGLIKSQILNETGRTGDTSVSSDVGNPGFSKTENGVKQLQERIGVSDNHLRKVYEEWFSRICETMLNLHFAYSKGQRELDLEASTMKRLNLEPGSTVTVDYDAEYGPIKYSVDASTSEAADTEKETETLTNLLELLTQLGPQPTAKQMLITNQIIKNSGVDDPEKLVFTDQEIEQAAEVEQMAKQQAAAQAEAAEQAQGAGAGMNAGAMPMPAMDTDADPQAEAAEPVLDDGSTPMPAEESGTAVQPGMGQLTPDELQTIETLRQRGVSDDDMATVLTMLRNGFGDEDIANVLMGAAQ